MGSQLVWQERFNIGVDYIDEEHKKLFGILNRMLMYRDQEVKGLWACKEGIKYFKDHAMKHFTEEENYMASINYKHTGTYTTISVKRHFQHLKANWNRVSILWIQLTIL